MKKLKFFETASTVILNISIIILVAVSIFGVAACKSPTDPPQSCDHVWDWVVTNPPTATEAGEETYTCLLCGETGEKRPIPATQTVISSVNVSITAPVNGGTPDTTASTTGTNYTLSAVTWSPANSKFLGGTAYTASLTLTANSSYTFSGLNSATINGQGATVSNNTGVAVTLSYTFPETDERTVTDIAITTQPTKLIYTHGDQLDLTGLVVTLTYDDTSTEDVAAAYFADKNITANPVHGVELVRSTHNDLSVTITYGNLSQYTSNLTVSKASGDFGIHTAIDTTYTSTLTLADLNSRLLSGYEWVTPSTFLNAGNNQSFYAIYTDPSENYEPASGSITVNVAKADGAAVTLPTVSGTPTINSITVAVSLETVTGQSIEYAVSTANNADVSTLTWQPGVTFTSLNSGTAHYVYARSVSNDSYNTGAASVSAAISTMQTVPQENIIYYWVDQHDSLVTTSGGVTTVANGATLTITAQGTGYEVKQWYLNGVSLAGIGNTFNFSSITAGNHTVSLFVEKGGKLYNTSITITVAIPYYTVTFNINGGIGRTPAAQTVIAGSSITLPGGSELTRSGYTFSGWNTGADGMGTTYQPGNFTPAFNITLYAMWVNYTITFNVNDGTGTVPAQTVPAGSSITVPSGSGLSRTGYVFGGWNTNDSGTGTNYSTGSSYTPTGNIILYARWHAGGTETEPIPLTENVWIDGSITSTANGSAVWYTFNVVATAGRNYYIWWNDSKQGNSTKTLDVKVSVYNSSGNIIASLEDVDSGWLGTGWSYSSGNGSTQAIKIKVTPYSGGNTGTFAIVYNTSGTRP